MSDNVETAAESPETKPEAQDGGEAPSASPEDAPPQESASTKNSEAARYRVKAREAEERSQELSTQLADARRQLVETTVAQKFADVDDFWAVTDLDTVLDDETGAIDGEKLDAAMQSTLTAKPHWARQAPSVERSSTVTSRDVVRGPATKNPSWQEVLQGKVQAR
jgi:hypothetical protein